MTAPGTSLALGETATVPAENGTKPVVLTLAVDKITRAAMPTPTPSNCKTEARTSTTSGTSP